MSHPVRNVVASCQYILGESSSAAAPLRDPAMPSSTTPFASSATMPGAITITACATSTPLVYAGGASSAGTSIGGTGAIGGASGYPDADDDDGDGGGAGLHDFGDISPQTWETRPLLAPSSEPAPPAGVAKPPAVRVL